MHLLQNNLKTIVGPFVHQYRTKLELCSTADWHSYLLKISSSNNSEAVAIIQLIEASNYFRKCREHPRIRMTKLVTLKLFRADSICLQYQAKHKRGTEC